MQIAKIIGREILDSRGNPTVEAEVYLTSGENGRASVPSGASTGHQEAYELRDKSQARYAGKGVRSAVLHINTEINQALTGASVNQQATIDTMLCELDGTKNKSRLGSNALLAVSLACARSHAKALKQPLYTTLNHGEIMSMPVPMINVLNGGVHADNNLSIQEFMLMPIGASDFTTALQMGAETFHALKAILKQQGLNTNVGDEGGFAPMLRSNQHALDLLMQAVIQAGFTLKKDFVFALDFAASELFNDGSYHLPFENKQLSSYEMINYCSDLAANYPIISIEDALDEGDWDGWQHLTAVLGNKLQLVGDDLFATNTELLQEGIKRKVANTILIKPNQIGTLSETRAAMQLANTNGYRCIISHRSGETEDTFIADLAVATGCGQIKTGSICRTDRVAKYNQLLRINELTTLPYGGNTWVKLKQQNFEPVS